MIKLAIGTKFTGPILCIVLTQWLSRSLRVLNRTCGPSNSINRGGPIAVAGVVVAAALPVAAGASAEVVGAVRLARPLRQLRVPRLPVPAEPQPPHRLCESVHGDVAISTRRAAASDRIGDPKP